MPPPRNWKKNVPGHVKEMHHIMQRSQHHSFLQTHHHHHANTACRHSQLGALVSRCTSGHAAAAPLRATNILNRQRESGEHMLIGWRVSSRQFDWWTTLHPPTTPLQSLHCGRRPAQYRRCATPTLAQCCAVHWHHFCKALSLSRSRSPLSPRHGNRESVRVLV